MDDHIDKNRENGCVISTKHPHTQIPLRTRIQIYYYGCHNTINLLIQRF